MTLKYDLCSLTLISIYIILKEIERYMKGNLNKSFGISCSFTEISILQMIKNWQLDHFTPCYPDTIFNVHCHEQVTIPLENISTVNPVIMTENPPEKYIQIVTVDGHEFWFMGFVNFEKALNHLLDSVSVVRAARAVLVG